MKSKLMPRVVVEMDSVETEKLIFELLRAVEQRQSTWHGNVDGYESYIQLEISTYDTEPNNASVSVHYGSRHV